MDRRARPAQRSAALGVLADASRQFEAEARRLEPRVRSFRSHVFDARHEPTKSDQLLHEVLLVRKRVEMLATKLHVAYPAAADACERAATLTSR